VVFAAIIAIFLLAGALAQGGEWAKAKAPGFRNSVNCKGKSIGVGLHQCSAWQDICDSTNGLKWDDCSEFRSDPCACYMVKCDGGNITSIALTFNSLSGSIPASLGQLVELDALDFSANSLNGTIPSCIGNLVKLSQVDLSDNRLSGSIPSELSKLRKLNQIIMYTNMLTGLVPPLPFAQYVNSCSLDSCDQAPCNHFKCPLPTDSKDCLCGVFNNTAGVHCK
jgi:hypothetical protein